MFKNILLIAGVTLVCLLALEPLTRIFLDTGLLYEIEMWKYATQVKERDYRPDVGHRHRADAHATLMNQDVRTDKNGFRSPPIPDRAASDTARIAFVGDSIMMGWGVAEQETMPVQVLNTLRAQGYKVDGFNQGVGNYNTLQEYTTFKDKGLPLKPDIIVLAYFINDGEPMQSYGNISWLEEHSEAWVTLKYRIDTLMRSSGEKPDWKQYYRDLYKDDAAGWKQTQKSLADFAKLAREQNIKIVVFNVPELHELKPYAFPDVTAKVRKVVEANDMKFVDLLPSVENLDPPSLWVTVPDPHPNGKAEIAMSKQIVPELLPLLDEICKTQGKGCASK